VSHLISVIPGSLGPSWWHIAKKILKAIVIKHLVSGDSEYETSQTDFCLYRFYCRFNLNTFELAQLISWL
jgi:hypothetical protein